MITEAEYFNAIKIINEYTDQVKKQSEKILQKTAITKTPKELYRYDFDSPMMSARLLNILHTHFEDKRICDITRKEFLSKRNAGKGSWSELCRITGNNLF